MDSPPMVLLRPGDRVLVTLTDEPEPARVAGALHALNISFPGVAFTVLSGVASVLVSSGELVS